MPSQSSKLPTIIYVRRDDEGYLMAYSSLPDAVDDLEGTAAIGTYKLAEGHTYRECVTAQRVD